MYLKDKIKKITTLVLAAVMLSACGAEEVPEIEEKEPPKVYNIPAAAEENNLLKLATDARGTETKICYLTFDDGPTNNVTPRVLDVLKQYNVKATFFVLGSMADKNPDILKRVYDEGHLIANHSYSHSYGDLYATAESFMAEINHTHQRITEITGEEPFKLVRFPGGSHKESTYGAQKQEYIGVLKQNGFYYADWNCLNGDAEAILRSAPELLAKIQQTAYGKNIVVLMHDAKTKTTTPDALGGIIEYLSSRGYEFKRLDEVEYYSETEKIQNSNSIVL